MALKRMSQTTARWSRWNAEVARLERKATRLLWRLQSKKALKNVIKRIQGELAVIR